MCLLALAGIHVAEPLLCTWSVYKILKLNITREAHWIAPSVVYGSKTYMLLHMVEITGKFTSKMPKRLQSHSGNQCYRHWLATTVYDAKQRCVCSASLAKRRSHSHLAYWKSNGTEWMKEWTSGCAKQRRNNCLLHERRQKKHVLQPTSYGRHRST